ncbi:unnamed protein product [Prorocentrum cordatum]|uniref:Uncharacterized protein n=1 Tax=Prorocentrum cordatum TaxID=2364126 RepID=A0ABN9SWJ2_9DINO|nr:unnamed protein product [Polarella glacialis]
MLDPPEPIMCTGFAVNVVGRAGFAGMPMPAAGAVGAVGGGAAGGAAGLAAALAVPAPAAPGGALVAGGGTGGAADGLALGGGLVPVAALAAGGAALAGRGRACCLLPWRHRRRQQPWLRAWPPRAPRAMWVSRAPPRWRPRLCPRRQPPPPRPRSLVLHLLPLLLIISDVRVQAVSLDVQGNRHRSFRDAILMMREDAWLDWPIRVRYRVEGAEKARLNAFREVRDFEDSRGVVYAEAAAHPPDYMPLGFMDVDPLLFEEIPADLMRPQDWKGVLAVRVGYDADIMQLEGEALALAYKHILRAGMGKERARAQRETRAATAQRLTAQREPLGSLTGLVQIAIRLATEVLYKKNATAFLDLCTKRGLDWHDVVEMDAAPAQHMVDCSHLNASSDHGAQRLGGLVHLYPSLQGQWGLQWPRAARASIPWKRRVPVGARLPSPKAVAIAMCLLLVEAGVPWMAVWVALPPVAYLRPGETFKCLWSFAVEALRPKYSRCSSLLSFPQVSDHLCGLRHGGALDGSVSRRRNAFQGGLQGRLASVKSLELYGKETKLLPEIRSAHGGVFRPGHLKLEHFWAVVMTDGTLEASIGHLTPATFVLAELLGLEKDAEDEETSELLATCTHAELQARGIAILKLAAGDSVHGRPNCWDAGASGHRIASPNSFAAGPAKRRGVIEPFRGEPGDAADEGAVQLRPPWATSGAC